MFAPLYERLHRRAGELSAKLTEGVGSLFFPPSVATLSRQLPPQCGWSLWPVPLNDLCKVRFGEMLRTKKKTANAVFFFIP